MIDCGFPIIRYSKNDQSREQGRQHGESFRAAIHELAEIRIGLMREKNPSLTLELIDQLAAEQWACTLEFDDFLAEEMQGIVDGANLSIPQFIVLNNYTDFRDIQIEEQGCSLAYVNQGHGPVVGQTWDMHGSAKNYVCCIAIDSDENQQVLFSVVGCVGMMGFNQMGCMLGVNNINTDKARSDVIWPALVRKVLRNTNLESMTHTLTQTPKTSGHNYLIAQLDRAQMWEVAPGCNDRVGEKTKGESGHLIHTNHCLGEAMKNRETTISMNSTTHARFDLLQSKISDVRTFEQMYDLMNDHENYPKSICSNFQTNAIDPSITCGGAVGHLDDGIVWMWRGDRLYDENFERHEFEFNEIVI